MLIFKAPQKLLYLATLLLGLVCYSAAQANTCHGFFEVKERDTKSTEKVFNEMTLAAQWAKDMLDGKDTNAAEERIKASSDRLIPYGRTYVGGLYGVPSRRVTQIFRIVHDSSHLIYLDASKDSLQLLIGAPVSKEMRDLATRNSAYLLLSQTEPKFHDLFKFIIKSSDMMKATHNIDAYAAGQDPYNREVSLIRELVLVPLDLNKNLTKDQLADFLLILWMSADYK